MVKMDVKRKKSGFNTAINLSNGQYTQNLIKERENRP